jgi:hypothetical protein
MGWKGVLFFSQFAVRRSVSSANHLSGAFCYSQIPTVGRDFLPENPDFQLEFEIFPGKNLSANLLLKFSPGKTRPHTCFQNFPREKLVRILAFRIFPGKKSSAYLLSQFSPGKTCRQTCFRNFPREKVVRILALRIFPGKIRIAGSLPGAAGDFQRLRSYRGRLEPCSRRLHSRFAVCVVALGVCKSA